MKTTVSSSVNSISSSLCIACVQYRGGVQYRGDIMSTVGVILSTVEVILSTMGDTQYRGGYHDARGRYREYHGGKSFII